MKKVPFLGKRILVFTAHPDDEGIAAGTMYANHKAGGETFLICATYGEKGKSHLARPTTDAALKRIRRNELLRAARVLHIKKVFFLGLPDAGLRENAKKLFEKSLPVIEKVAPEQMISFGPDGMSGHWDHITVGKAALQIAKRLQVPLAAATVGLAMSSRRRKFFAARRKFGKYKDIAEHRKGDIKIEIDVAVKRRAMSNHRSQFPGGTPFAALPKRVAKQMFSYEHFVNEKI